MRKIGRVLIWQFGGLGKNTKLKNAKINSCDLYTNTYGIFTRLKGFFYFFKKAGGGQCLFEGVV